MTPPPGPTHFSRAGQGRGNICKLREKSVGNKKSGRTEREEEEGGHYEGAAQEGRDIKNPTRHDRAYNSTSGALTGRVSVSPLESCLTPSEERNEFAKFVQETETETALKGHKSPTSSTKEDHFNRNGVGQHRKHALSKSPRGMTEFTTPQVELKQAEFVFPCQGLPWPQMKSGTRSPSLSGKQRLKQP